MATDHFYFSLFRKCLVAMYGRFPFPVPKSAKGTDVQSTLFPFTSQLRWLFLSVIFYPDLLIIFTHCTSSRIYSLHTWACTVVIFSPFISRIEFLTPVLFLMWLSHGVCVTLSFPKKKLIITLSHWITAPSQCGLNLTLVTYFGCFSTFKASEMSE